VEGEQKLAWTDGPAACHGGLHPANAIRFLRAEAPSRPGRNSGPEGKDAS